MTSPFCCVWKREEVGDTCHGDQAVIQSALVDKSTELGDLGKHEYSKILFCSKIEAYIIGTVRKKKIKMPDDQTVDHLFHTSVHLILHRKNTSGLYMGYQISHRMYSTEPCTVFYDVLLFKL